MRRTLRLGLGAFLAAGALLTAACGDSDLADCFADGAYSPLPGENTDESFEECIIDAGENLNLNQLEAENSLDEAEREEEGDDDAGAESTDDASDDVEEEGGEGDTTSDVDGDDDFDNEFEEDECEECEDDEEEGEGQPADDSDEESDAD